MAQGGTLPIKREQTVSLYNTTGVIERHKNIYFSPFITRSTSKIKDIWLDKFKLECPSPTDYTDISISQWSPEDRTLKVRGNVDDFRLVTEHGLALNYLILTRKVYDSENSFVTYYYAFFITSVSQAGSGSVLLSLEPDHFTNVFYLHNEEVFWSVSSNDKYDAFNSKMKNNYVVKQHYNRVKIQNESYVDVALDLSPSQFIAQQDNGLKITVELTEEGLIGDKTTIRGISPRSPFILTVNGVETSYSTGITQTITVVNNGFVLTMGFPNSSSIAPSEVERFQLTIRTNPYTIREDNLPIFSQIEESFKFKRLVKDYKRQLNYGNMLTDEELEEIESEDVFSNLSLDLRKKILKMCVAYLYVGLTDNKVLYGDNYINTGVEQTSYVEHYLPYFPNTRTPNYYSSFCVPMIIVPDLFKKYSISQINFYAKYNNSRFTIKTGGSTSSDLISNVDEIVHCLLDTVINPYVITAYISRECSLSNVLEVNDSLECEFNVSYNQIVLLPDMRGVSNSSQVTKLNEIIGNNLTLGNYVRYTEVIGNQFTIKRILAGASGSGSDSYDSVYFGLYVNGKRSVLDNSKCSFNLDLSPETLSLNRLTSSYYDTVLTFAPYEYYTISLYGRLETIFNKLNYYENPVIECELSVMATDFLKYAFTPTYTIGGLKQKYYSEGFEQTFSNNITVKSDKLADYLVVNSAQMKSQYTIANSNAMHDLFEQYVRYTQHIGLGVVSGKSTGGTFGGIAGAGKAQVGEEDKLVATGVQWEKSRANISISQTAKLADMGMKPDSYKQVGTDIYTDLSINELGLYFNHYKIDEVSYNSICKYLERFGYTVNIYDDLHVTTRVGWDFVQLASFDYEATINTIQEESIRQIFAEGVTLLHNKSVLTSGHNYETILEEVM